MYQKKADVLAARVGSYFHFTSHRVSYHIMGEVKMARGFENDSLYMHLEFELPAGWEVGDHDYNAQCTPVYHRSA